MLSYYFYTVSTAELYGKPCGYVVSFSQYLTRGAQIHNSLFLTGDNVSSYSLTHIQPKGNYDVLKVIEITNFTRISGIQKRALEVPVNFNIPLGLPSCITTALIN